MQIKITLIAAVIAVVLLAGLPTCEAACALNIYVEDSSGNPIEGASVWIAPSGGIPSGVRLTDEFGEAVFNNLTPGWYDINVSKDGVTIEDEVYVDNLKRRRHVVVLG